jgi:hypothetical protein
MGVGLVTGLFQMTQNQSDLKFMVLEHQVMVDVAV